MLKKYKHISFDLDGTLVHTIPEYRYQIVPEVIRFLGGKMGSDRDIDKFWFEPDRDNIIKDKFGLDPDRFWQIFRRLDIPEERAKQTFAYGDAEACIRKIKGGGKKVSVITGAPENIARMEIAKLNGAPIDLFFATLFSHLPTKPAPDGLFFVLNKLGVNSADTVYIGNSNEDALFAKNAGVDFIYLERKQHEFDSMDWAIKTIHSLGELIE